MGGQQDINVKPILMLEAVETVMVVMMMEAVAVFKLDIAVGWMGLQEEIYVKSIFMMEAAAVKVEMVVGWMGGWEAISCAI